MTMQIEIETSFATFKFGPNKWNWFECFILYYFILYTTDTLALSLFANHFDRQLDRKQQGHIFQS